jgi:hypothetical protein
MLDVGGEVLEVVELSTVTLTLNMRMDSSNFVLVTGKLSKVWLIINSLAKRMVLAAACPMRLITCPSFSRLI